MHRRYAFASLVVGKNFLQSVEDIRVHDVDKSGEYVDDLTLAFEKLKLYVAINDAHVFYNGSTTRRVNIKEIAIYIMAPYGFDDLGQDVPYLGHFNKKHFALVTDGDWVNAPVYTGKDPHAKHALLRPVTKAHFIQWRQTHNKGGDMLLFSVRRPAFANMDVVVPNKPSPTGTLYWGGAGLDGPYIQLTLQALQSAGISNVYVGLTNSATKTRAGNFGTIIDAFRAGMIIRYEDDGEWRLTSGMHSGEGQFNLTAEGDDIYAGMPQSSFANPLFVEKLGADMLGGKGEGHFYYGHAVPGLDTRLKALAEFIASKGVR